MAENLDTGLTVEAWSEIVIKEWVNKASMLGIAPYDPINLDRFTHHVITNANGDPVKVEFAYDYFLNFVDWGVGSGVTMEDRDALIAAGTTSRRPKPWFTDVFYKQISVLTHLLAEKTKQKAQIFIVNGLEKK